MGDYLIDDHVRIVLQALGIIIVLVLLYGLSNNECQTNRDCGSMSYCRFDNTCQPIATDFTQSTHVVTKEKSVFILPSLAVGLLLVGGSLYYVKRSR